MQPQKPTKNFTKTERKREKHKWSIYMISFHLGFKVFMHVYSETLNPESYFSRKWDRKATTHAS